MQPADTWHTETHKHIHRDTNKPSQVKVHSHISS